MPGPTTFARLSREPFAALGRAWAQLWFESSSTAPLELCRIGIGALLLFYYGLVTPNVLELWGEAGWMPREIAYQYLNDPWVMPPLAQSVFFYFTASWQWLAFHIFFLLCCFAFMVGWRTSWVKWVVFAGKVSYDYRNPALIYGIDSIFCCVLFILCLAPIGRALSLDRVRVVRAAKRNNLAAVPPCFTSPWAGACTKLIQFQMAVLFFYSAVKKLQYPEWWNGDAIWLVFTLNDYYNSVLATLLAQHYWLSDIGTYGTILIEIAYPFLIWQRRTRPYMLAAAIFLHLMFAFLMQLIFFAVGMIMGHLSFVRPEWLHRLGAWWKRKIGDMEMIYDGHCGFCVRSMAWLLAFDGLGQVRVRDFRADPSPVVSDAQLEKRLYVVLPDGHALPGFEAYRHVVLRVPGLWWLVPFFHVPVLSRLVGHPIYDWVAANRSRPSTGGIAKRWRERALYSAMSLFVGWHTFVMVVGPNNSETAASARRWLQPYLSFFRLESTWAFFAPSVGKRSQFRYVIQDRAAQEHTFVPVRELNPYFASYYLIKHSYDDIITFPGLYAEFFAAMFCRQHAALQPVYITLQASLEREFWPADQLAGKNPHDPEFAQVETVLQVPCKNAAGAGAQ